jgi:peroxiredoxin Q/BCP
MKASLITALTLIALVLLASMTVALADSPKMAAVGDLAPLVDGKDQDGKDWKLLYSTHDHGVVLYFYPHDIFPVCAQEARSFRDSMADFKKYNVEVIGISCDTVESHQKLATNQALNFRLIADPEGQIADAFGVRIKKGINRARSVSFLIGRDRKILAVLESDEPDVPVNKMKKTIEKLTKKK